MTSKAPKAGRRILLEHIGPLWRRMSFSWKVSARNILRYKRRFLMTVIGVSGCTALMLVGFGLHDAIWDIIDVQFGQIQRYDMTVSIARGLDDASAGRVRRTLVDGGAKHLTRVDARAMLAKGSGSDDLAVQVVVARDPARLARSIDFRGRIGHRPVAFGADSVLVTEKAARTLGVGSGDDLALSRQNAMGDATGAARRIPVTGVVENYVGNVVYLGPDAWERLAQGADGWDTDLAYGTWYATAPAGQEACDRLADALRADRAVATVGYVQTTVGTYRTMLSAIDVIVVVLIVAAALAFIVLYDLTTIDIGERIREIATLKVLGFRRGEVDAYVFREMAVLVLVGALAGLGLGTWLEGFVITTVEVDVVMFGRTIHAASYLWAFLLAGLFAAVVMLAMRPRLAAIDMVESLKSVD